MVTHIENLDELHDILKEDPENTLILIEFYATWCKACKILAEAITKLASRNVPNTKFISIDVDESLDIANEYDIIMLPTVLFIKSENVIEVLTGAKVSKLHSLLIKLNVDHHDEVKKIVKEILEEERKDAKRKEEEEKEKKKALELEEKKEAPALEVQKSIIVTLDVTDEVPTTSQAVEPEPECSSTKHKVKKSKKRKSADVDVTDETEVELNSFAIEDAISEEDYVKHNSDISNTFKSSIEKSKTDAERESSSTRFISTYGSSKKVKREGSKSENSRESSDGSPTSENKKRKIKKKSKSDLEKEETNGVDVEEASVASTKELSSDNKSTSKTSRDSKGEKKESR